MRIKAYPHGYASMERAGNLYIVKCRLKIRCDDYLTAAAYFRSIRCDDYRTASAYFRAFKFIAKNH